MARIRPQMTDERLDDDALALFEAQRDKNGLGEMIAALVLIGSLLLAAWIVVAAGLLEGDVAPSIPDDLDVQEAPDVNAGDGDGS